MKSPIGELSDHLRASAAVATLPDGKDGEALARIEHLRRLLAGPLGAGEARARGEGGPDDNPTSNPTLS